MARVGRWRLLVIYEEKGLDNTHSSFQRFAMSDNRAPCACATMVVNFGRRDLNPGSFMGPDFGCYPSFVTPNTLYKAMFCCPFLAHVLGAMLADVANLCTVHFCALHTFTPSLCLPRLRYRRMRLTPSCYSIWYGSSLSPVVQSSNPVQ